MWFFAVLVVLALGGVALLAAGRGTPMADVYDDRPDASVPATGTLSADDLRRVRFSLAFRGYRMSEVDALLDRLAREREEAAEPTAPTEPADRPAHGNDDPQ
jgi:DivIVA domain-containing protein